QSITIYGGDGGDLVAAALVRGIAHPPGYPLYVFLGFIATKIPYSTPAWRVSLLSTIPSILSLVFFYLTLKLILKKSLTSLITTFILGVTYLFWLFSIVPEVFALNNFFIIILIYLIIKWFLSRQNLFFYLWILVLGFSLSHHHTIILMLPACFYLFFLRKSSLLSLSKLKILLLFSIG
ncbi:MAG: DUF2723 domain-containing protein, partial [Actinobacteria bacterium]|nr:DUF2723 domain-containing protein [Actinomycetota bacterium]